MRYALIAVLLSSILVGCDSGSGGGSPTTGTPPDVSFLTTSPDTDEIGESQRFDLTGTVSGNGQTESITGSYTVTRKPNEQLSGEEVQVYDAVFVITIPSQSVSIASSSTSYVKLDGTLLFERLDTGVECFPNADHRAIPASVKIGESGVLGSSGCSDGSTISSSYIVEQSTRSSNWAVVRVFATFSAPGQADIYEDISVHISEDGRVHAMEVSAGDGQFSFELRS